MPRFIVEDQAHRALVMTLLNVPQKKFTLGKDRGKTCRLVAEGTNVLGLVDEDPRGPGLPEYLRSLPPAHRFHDLSVFRDLKQKNVVIVFCPSVEAWVFDKARRKRVDVPKLVGTTSSTEFHKEINRKIDKWVNLIRQIEVQNSEALLYLKSLLEN